MKSSNYYKRLSLALVLVLLLLTLFVACDDGAGGDETTGDAPDESTTGGENPEGSNAGGEGSDPENDETTAGTGGGESGGSSGDEAATVTYTVTVVDGAGAPIKNVAVKLSSGKQGVTNASGVATIKEAAGNYTFTLEMIGGGDAQYLYSTALCVLSEASPAATVSFVKKASFSDGGETIWADPDGDETRTEYRAPYVGTGTIAVELERNDMSYVLFRPQTAGQYRVSATSSISTVSVGNYGMPAYVQTNNIAEKAGTSYFEINVRAGSIGTESTGTLVVVVGLKHTDGTAGNVLLTIERIGDPLTDISDIPFDEITADSKYLKATPEVSGTLTDIDIRKSDITIVKGSDGYYHYGSASGPIVMLRITSASPYIDSLSQINDCQSLAYYEYDSSGECVTKERWNGVITAMKEYVNEDGVVPLNDQLITMMKRVGTHMGWWQDGGLQYLFADVEEVTENAYLFACCYYA